MHIVNKPSVTLVAVAISLLCACGGGRHETTEVYILVAANTRIAYWQEAAEGLRTAARELGVKSEMVGPETYDPKAEKEEFLKVVHRQVSPAGILVSAADPELMREAIDSAAAAGIPVVTIDAGLPQEQAFDLHRHEQLPRWSNDWRASRQGTQREGQRGSLQHSRPGESG
jgi:ribose transport system substrate-binding protein